VVSFRCPRSGPRRAAGCGRRLGPRLSRAAVQSQVDRGDDAGRLCGADQIAIHVSNTMGWKIMRNGSVSDETWNEIAAIYVRDKLGLSLRQWFEAENPFAFQDMSEVLLESSRKGIGRPSRA